MTLERLEPRYALSAVPFSSPPPLTSDADGAASVITADLDQDGDLDLVTASKLDNTIGWHENSNGAGAFAARAVISTNALGATAVIAADLNGDAKTDILAASSDDNTIAWFENLGNATFSAANVISSQALGAVDLVAGDLDRDGDLDVVAATADNDTVAWYENSDGQGTFAAAVVIDSAALGAAAVTVTDLDGDGDLDVVAASSDGDSLAWYANTNGVGSFAVPQSISSTAAGARDVVAGDLDGDGDADIVAASYDADTVSWFENTNGAGLFGPAQTISSSAAGATALRLDDLDSDGDLDVVAALRQGDTLEWYENTDAVGTFAAGQSIGTALGGPASVIAADIDGDGDTDVAATAYDDDAIVWRRNDTIHRSAAFHDTQNFIPPDDKGSRSVRAADIDGDGDLDAVYAFSYYDSVVWAENTGDRELAGPYVIDAAADQVWSVFPADMDGDGDVDVLAAASEDDKIIWYENLDAMGTFGAANIVADDADAPCAIVASDLDGDGDLDVIAALFYSDTVAWYENLDGGGTFALGQVVANDADGAVSVDTADVDGDGDFDIVAASPLDNTVAWFENTDGQGTFGPKNVITSLADGVISVRTADLDGDGDQDVLSASSSDDTIAWYENIDGAGLFGLPQVLSNAIGGAAAVVAADLDADGDLDIIASSFSDDFIVWFENLDGAGTFSSEQLVSDTAPGPFALDVADLDADGDLDILAANYALFSVVWYENRGGQVALPTTDTSAAAIVNGRHDDVLRIDVQHRGQSGDHDAEWASLDLLFEDSANTPLSSDQANGLFASLGVYLDDGDGSFDSEQDSLVNSVETFVLTAGHLVVEFDDGDPLVQVTAESSRTFFVVIEMTADASAQADGSFRVTHLTASSSTAEDREADIPLKLEFPLNVATSLIDTGQLGDMDRDRDVDLDDVNPFVLGLTDPAAYEETHGVPPALYGDIDGDGDLDLDDVDGFVAILVGTPGAGAGGQQTAEQPSTAGGGGSRSASSEAPDAPDSTLRLITQHNRSIQADGLSHSMTRRPTLHPHQATTPTIQGTRSKQTHLRHSHPATDHRLQTPQPIDEAVWMPETDWWWPPV